ncbi:hypothetical protein ACIHCX_17155 [Streptomyces sp. NPDC052043]|uniref:hypothetical protein n=1 Tax=Streptomyces sp. NPDC052043 TaxID=3365684 RepID=UPI0037D6BF72
MRKHEEDRAADEPDEPDASREPDHQEHMSSHAGNGTVNHSPDELGLEGLDSDELALRRMLHQAVQDVEPRDGTLEHLRRAVPARRARKRQAAVGMAAAALFIGTAVPALVHVSHTGDSDANPAIAGQASQAQGGASQGKDPEGGESGFGGSSGKATGGGAENRKDDPESSPGSAADSGPTGDPDSSSSPSGSDAPVCTAAQLGSAAATVDTPDSAGVVYGTFHVANVSTGSCRVGGAGSVSTLAQGEADAGRITVVAHTSGDAAAGLPDPSTEAPGLLLPSGSAYEVKFAWVPSQTCPTTGGGSTGGNETGAPSSDPSPTQGVTTTGATSPGADSGVTTQMLQTDGPADGSVVVSHTPEAGSPSASVTVPNACAGTVYRTGVLPES